MRMNMTPRQKIEIAPIMKLRGGATRSVFPEVESWLDRNTDRARALEFVGSRKSMDRYKSIMDFVFCESFHWHQRACFLFYEGNGSPLRFMIEDQQRRGYERALRHIVERAYECFCEKRRKGDWEGFLRSTWDEVIAMLAA